MFISRRAPRTLSLCIFQARNLEYATWSYGTRSASTQTPQSRQIPPPSATRVEESPHVTRSDIRMMRPILERHFRQGMWPSRERMTLVAHELDMTFAQVSAWFRNRRHDNGCSRQRQSVLLDHFNRDLYPSREHMQLVSEELGMTLRQVSLFWGYRRGKLRLEGPSDDVPLHATRPRFTAHQTEKLRDVFQRTPDPTTRRIEKLAKDLGEEDPERIARWFKRQRSLNSFPTKFKRLPPDVRAVLEDTFALIPYPTREIVSRLLADHSILTPTKLSDWFNHRRKAERSAPVRPCTEVMSLLVDENMSNKDIHAHVVKTESGKALSGGHIP